MILNNAFRITMKMISILGVLERLIEMSSAVFVERKENRYPRWTIGYNIRLVLYLGPSIVVYKLG